MVCGQIGDNENKMSYGDALNVTTRILKEFYGRVDMS